MALSKNGLELCKMLIYVAAVLWIFTVTASIMVTYYLSDNPIVFRIEADDNMVKIADSMSVVEKPDINFSDYPELLVLR